MVEHFLQFVTSAPTPAVYCIILFLPFIENIFPLSPSDLIITVAGTMIGKHLNFPLALFLAALSSEAGFMLLYYLGTQTDKKVVRAGKLKFISSEALTTAENWFNRYGFFIILLNRFVPGIRSVIAFFAGLSELSVRKTIILSSISSFLWALGLLITGILLAPHIEQIDKAISAWGNIPVILIIIGIIYYFVSSSLSKRKAFDQR
jgi:membrane protein DedA with SNARE-associated domain